VQVQHGSGPARELDIIVLDTCRGEVIDILSSSCDLLIFSSKVGSHLGENAGVTLGGCRVQA
jgi:hypothetical protein